MKKKPTFRLPEASPQLSLMFAGPLGTTNTQALACSTVRMSIRHPCCKCWLGRRSAKPFCRTRHPVRDVFRLWIEVQATSPPTIQHLARNAKRLNALHTWLQSPGTQAAHRPRVLVLLWCGGASASFLPCCPCSPWGLDRNWSWRYRELFKGNWQAGGVETNVVRRAKNSDMPLLRLVPFWSTLHQFTQHLSSFSPWPRWQTQDVSDVTSCHTPHHRQPLFTPLWRTPCRHGATWAEESVIVEGVVPSCCMMCPSLTPTEDPCTTPTLQTTDQTTLQHTPYTPHPSTHKGRKCHWASSLCFVSAKLEMTTRSEAPCCHVAEHGLWWRDTTGHSAVGRNWSRAVQRCRGAQLKTQVSPPQLMTRTLGSHSNSRQCNHARASLWVEGVSGRNRRCMTARNAPLSELDESVRCCCWTFHVGYVSKSFSPCQQLWQSCVEWHVDVCSCWDCMHPCLLFRRFLGSMHRIFKGKYFKDSNLRFEMAMANLTK